MERINLLEEKISIKKISLVSYKVHITYKNARYSTISGNMRAYERLASHMFLRKNDIVFGYTYPQALKAFYMECKEKNNLN